MRLAIIIALMTVSIGTANAYDDDSCEPGYYRAVSGDCVEHPDGNQGGAAALCRDGTYSHSEHPHSGGTCSHHGGVDHLL